jgi:hypothetical protein
MGGQIHTRIRVFAGPDHDHLALAGVLVFRDDEATEFIGMARQGGAIIENVTEEF